LRRWELAEGERGVPRRSSLKCHKETTRGKYPFLGGKGDTVKRKETSATAAKKAAHLGESRYNLPSPRCGDQRESFISWDGRDYPRKRRCLELPR